MVKLKPGKVKIEKVGIGFAHVVSVKVGFGLGFPKKEKKRSLESTFENLSVDINLRWDILREDWTFGEYHSE